MRRRRILSGFSPAKIPGCALWFEADRGILTVDGKVSSWLDMSGNGYVISQSTPGSRPSYSSTIINGKPGVSFGGTQFLTAASITLSSAFTVSIVGTVGDISGATESYLYDFGSSYGDTNRLSVGSYYRIYLARSETKSRWNSYNGLDNTELSVFRQIGNGTHASEKFFINGTQETLSTDSANENDLGAVDLNGPFWLGVGKGITYPFIGNIAGIVIFNRALSGSECQLLESHYARKYGITLS